METKIDFQGFVGPTNVMRSDRFDGQRTVNMFVEMNPIANGGKEGHTSYLMSTPGLQTLWNLGSSPIRQLYTPASNPSMMFIVCGNQVFRVDAAVTNMPILLSGTLATSTGPVVIADNGLQVFIVDGAAGYWISIASPGAVTTITNNTDVHFHPASAVTYQDGYFVFNEAGTNNIFQSNLFNYTFPSLNEAGKMGNSDNVVACISNNRQLYVFGTQTTEIWQNSGASAVTPFTRQDGKFMGYGCSSAASISKVGNTLIWLGTTGNYGAGQVFQLVNETATRISTHAIEMSIAKAPSLANATSYSYQEQGHYFYVLNIPSMGTTLVYDIETAMWHERQHMVNGVINRHPGNCHTFFANNHLVGDYATGKVYLQNLDYPTNDGIAIPRIRQSPHCSKDNANVFYRMFELDMEFGVGQSGGPVTAQNAVDPTVMLEVSNDGGKTWSAPRYVKMGQIGKFKTRARWHKLGYSRDKMFRVTVTDPVKVVILSAKLDVQQGRS